MGVNGTIRFISREYRDYDNVPRIEACPEGSVHSAVDHLDYSVGSQSNCAPTLP